MQLLKFNLQSASNYTRLEPLPTCQMWRKPSV